MTTHAPTIDTDAPILNHSNPFDESNFKIENNLTLYFDETVMAGSGDIIISNGSDTRTIAIDDTSQITYSNNFSGNRNKIIINPTENLIPNTSYNIQIASGVITDTVGNAYAGINDETTLNFTTIPSNPLLFGSNLWDTRALKIDNDIQLYFDETVIAGSGDIIISNGSDTRTIAIDDTSQVVFDINTVFINPIKDLIPNTIYNIQMANGVINDVEGNAYTGVNDEVALSFATINTDPLLAWSNSWYGSTFKADNDIQLYFDEMVAAGSGNIFISNGTDTRTIDINDADQVLFDDYNGVTINPTEDLIPNASYHIQMPSGVITDADGNAYAGISDETTLNYTTVTASPVLAWSNLQDDSTFKIDNDIQLYFDEMVIAGSGNILISNGSDTRTIDINDSNQVTFDEYSGVTINLNEDLILGSNYNIQMPSGVITDSSGNAFTSINEETTLNFTTVSSNPLLTWSSSQDDSTLKFEENIQLNFDEEVIAGSGDIIISNGSDTRTIAIDDTSQVVFNSSKSSVTINPMDDLVPNTSYNIQIASGVITDTDGNAYAGISDDTTLNFSAINSNPLLVGSNPWNEETDVHISNNLHLYFDEKIVAGSGNIIISNGSDIHMIDINDTSQVSFDGYGSIVINPSTNLLADTRYNIQMTSGVISDADGNPYAGISDASTLNFTTTDDPAFISMMGMNYLAI